MRFLLHYFLRRRAFVFAPFAVLAASVLLAGCVETEGGSDAVVTQAVVDPGTSGTARWNRAEAGTSREEGRAGPRAEEAPNRVAEPVDFRALRALLPQAVGDLAQTEREGQKGGTLGVSISTAAATYEGPEGERVTVEITDMGALTGDVALGFGWAMADIDRESTSGYERTMRYEGHRAHEKYNRDRRHGEMQVLVADRFAVEVRGREVEMEVLEDTLDRIDLVALRGMKDRGLQGG